MCVPSLDIGRTDTLKHTGRSGLQASDMSTSAALLELTGLDNDDVLIGDVARLSGLSIDTLRYCDRAGLLGAVHRDGCGRRVFDPDSLGLLDVVLRLRRTGMPVRRYATLLTWSGRATPNVRGGWTCCGLIVAGCWRSSTSSTTIWQ